MHLDIAIMVELGKRMRVIVLGMISALLPTKENDLVRLHMDALGLLNLGQMSVAIDAVLVDSRLAQKFVLTGEMALRASMLPGRRNFVMAVGGFNPRFAPPENFPTLKRITIALASGNNPRLTCEAYFAITSNTIQFGARAQLYAAAFGFSIEGDVGFDVLDPPAAVPPDRGLQGVGAAQARLAQSLQAVGVRNAGRAAAAAHQRQGVVRDLLVRLHDPLRQDAHLGREAAVAAGRRCIR